MKLHTRGAVVGMGTRFDANKIQLKGYDHFIERLLVKEFPSLREIFTVFFLDGASKNSLDESHFLQSYLRSLYEQFKETPRDFGFKEQILVNHLLAFYPLFYSKDFSLIDIPQKTGEELELITYASKKIRLTPKFLGSQVTALALESENRQPLLIFKPTPIPSSEGALLSYLTDVNPFSCVGGYLFYFAKDTVREWLKMHPQTQVIGLSLGGALAQLTVSYFPEYISDAYIYNAPALWKRDIKRAAAKALPKVYIINNKNDLVSQTGTSYLESSERYELYDRSAGRNHLIAHIRIYSADAEHVLVKRGGKRHFDMTRKAITFLHTLFSIPLFILGSLILAIKRLFRFLIGRKSDQFR